MTTTRIALITGGNKGLGLEIARQLGAAGVHPIITCRDPAKAAPAIADLARTGVAASAVTMEVTDAGQIAAAAARIGADHGRLDILVNNAGIAVDFGKRPSDVDADAFRQVFAVNLFAVVEVTRAFLPLLRKGRSPRIVNHSSSLGSLTVNADPADPIPMDFVAAAYNASKAALNMYTVTLARELRSTGILVNSAHPGWVRTDLGGPNAPLDVVTGAKTAVELALLPDGGPTGTFQHLGQMLPW